MVREHAIGFKKRIEGLFLSENKLYRSALFEPARHPVGEDEQRKRTDEIEALQHDAGLGIALNIVGISLQGLIKYLPLFGDQIQAALHHAIRILLGKPVLFSDQLEAKDLHQILEIVGRKEKQMPRRIEMQPLPLEHAALKAVDVRKTHHHDAILLHYLGDDFQGLHRLGQVFKNMEQGNRIQALGLKIVRLQASNLEFNLLYLGSPVCRIAFHLYAIQFVLAE